MPVRDRSGCAAVGTRSANTERSRNDEKLLSGIGDRSQVTFHCSPRALIVVGRLRDHVRHHEGLGGAGAVELILSAMSLHEQTIAPCPNSTPDQIEFPGLNLSCGPAKPAKIRATLNTSLGFGGANTAAILAAPVGATLASPSPDAQQRATQASPLQHPIVQEQVRPVALDAAKPGPAPLRRA